MRIQTYLLLASLSLTACDQESEESDGAFEPIDSSAFGILDAPSCSSLGMATLGQDGQFSDDAINYVHAALPTPAATNLSVSINNARHSVFLTVNAFRTVRAGAGSVLIRPVAIFRETGCNFGRCKDRLQDQLRLCVPTSHPQASVSSGTLNFCNWAFPGYLPIGNTAKYKMGKALDPVEQIGSNCGTSYTQNLMPTPPLRYSTRQSMATNEATNPSKCVVPLGENANEWIVKQITEVTSDLAQSTFGGDSDCQYNTAAERKNTGYTVQWCCGYEKNYNINGVGGVNMADLDAWIVKYGHQASRGDYDGNGQNDGNDFLVWQRSLGMGGRFKYGDANLDGQVNAADRVVWESYFGQLTPIAAADRIADVNIDGAINWDDYLEMCDKLVITP